MNRPPAQAIRTLVVGANHRSSSLSLRDTLFVDDADVPGFLGRLRRVGIEEAMVLSTCDRVEVQGVAADPEAAADDVKRVLAEHAGVEGSALDGQLYVLMDEAALRHVFNVTASLDSMVVGEPQVLGQVKAGHRMARAAGMAGSGLEAVLQAAYGAAKRVRRETAIGERPVSIAAAAVGLARDLHGDLARCTGLLVGAGDMAELVAAQLLEGGLGHLSVVDPVDVRAETVARSLDCHVAPFETLSRLMENADVAITAHGGRRHVLTADRVRAALRERRRKPMFLIDAAVPGDVEPAVDRLDDAFLYDLGDLERIALEGRASREAEAGAAAAIIDAEVATFLRGRAERTAVPAVDRLRRHFEGLREAALAEAGDDAEKATRLLINRLLHGPMAALRATAAEGGGDWPAIERVLRRLFDLGPEEPEDPEVGGADPESEEDDR